MSMNMQALGEVFDLPSNGELFRKELHRTTDEIVVTIDTQAAAVAVELHDILILYSDALYEEYGEAYLYMQNQNQSQYLDVIHATWEQENFRAQQSGTVARNLSLLEQEDNPLIRECKRWWVKKRNEYEALKQFTTLSRTLRFGIAAHEANRQTDETMKTVFATAADHFRNLPAIQDAIAPGRQQACVNMAEQLSNKHNALIATSGSIAKSLRRSFAYFYPNMPERYKP